MRLLYGTGNPAKLESMEIRLAKLDIELLGLQDLAAAATNQYYYDLPPGRLEQVAVEDGFLQFFQKVLNLKK